MALLKGGTEWGQTCEEVWGGLSGTSCSCLLRPTRARGDSVSQTDLLLFFSVDLNGKGRLSGQRSALSSERRPGHTSGQASELCLLLNIPNSSTLPLLHPRPPSQGENLPEDPPHRLSLSSLPVPNYPHLFPSTPLHSPLHHRPFLLHRYRYATSRPDTLTLLHHLTSLLHSTSTNTHHKTSFDSLLPFSNRSLTQMTPCQSLLLHLRHLSQPTLPTLLYSVIPTAPFGHPSPSRPV